MEFSRNSLGMVVFASFTVLVGCVEQEGMLKEIDFESPLRESELGDTGEPIAEDTGSGDTGSWDLEDDEENEETDNEEVDSEELENEEVDSEEVDSEEVDSEEVDSEEVDHPEEDDEAWPVVTIESVDLMETSNDYPDDTLWEVVPDPYLYVEHVPQSRSCDAVQGSTGYYQDAALPVTYHEAPFPIDLYECGMRTRFFIGIYDDDSWEDDFIGWVEWQPSQSAQERPSVVEISYAGNTVRLNLTWHDVDAD